MHPAISVAVPTRHRWPCLNGFISSFLKTTDKLANQPVLTIIHDAPDAYDEPMVNSDSIQNLVMRSVWLPTKSGLSELWNWSIILAPTEWVLICNDDITFNDGWVKYLEDTIATGKYLMIELFHYGAMCVSKQFVLEHGWFDERYTGGGFEDVDSQLRLAECGIKDKVDKSHDFIRREGNVEIGHFVNHLKYEYKATPWHGNNNGDWIKEKWGRSDNINWKRPSIRKAPDIDWHPAYTIKYMQMYGYNTVPWHNKQMQSYQEQREIFP